MNADPIVARGSELAEYLLLFTRDAIHSEKQKRALKKACLIQYAHGMWFLSKMGKAEAVRLGYLEA